MKTFSEWLDEKQKNPKSDVQITNALEVVKKFDGKPGPHTPDKEISQILDGYYAQVVKKGLDEIRQQPQRVAMEEAFNKLLHRSQQAGATGIEMWRKGIDDLVGGWNKEVKKGGVVEEPAIKPSKPVLQVFKSGGEIGNIELVQIFDKSMFDQHIGGRSNALPKDQKVKLTGKMEVHKTSREDFASGLPRTAWVGIVEIASRTGAPHDIVYLVANNSMYNHVSAPHLTKGKYNIQPVTHGAQPGHNAAIQELIKGGYTKPKQWNGCKVEKGVENETGCFFGFSMVKQDSGAGHYWNWTSFSMNFYANGEFGDFPTEVENLNVAQKKAYREAQMIFQKKPRDWTDADRAALKKHLDVMKDAKPTGRRFIATGDSSVPEHFAKAVWEATRELT